MKFKEEELTLLIKQIGRRVGFNLICISQIKTPVYFNKYKEWLLKGYYADMVWLKDTYRKRINILELFPECSSIIVCAEAYYRDFDTQGIAKIARYATYEDYHKRIRDKLNKLIDELIVRVPELKNELKYMICVDSEPIIEKAWAVEAGIGWMGKNTLIITRDYGSWILLGELLVNVSLVPDKSKKNYCGKCNKCIEACPTGAIVKPYVLDASKCISYLTIENKGEIPKEYIDMLNGYIFGCDICQEVCPYNSKINYKCEIVSSSILPRYFQKKELEEILNYTVKEFRKRFYDFSINRIGLNRLKRNIESVLRQYS